MATSFFGGSFFGGEFFNAPAAPGVSATGAGIGGRKRRWVQIGEVLYHATEDDIQAILARAPAESKPEVKPIHKRKAKKILAKQALQKPVVITEPWDDEDDVEFLLLH
jgi:hypothetical protein